ncbi:MAG: hypothetical protein M9924_13950 [Rhizobiaceae bacterium]|nr:hypothetical protein [Rhizobiaceae bacterium]
MSGPLSTFFSEIEFQVSTGLIVRAIVAVRSRASMAEALIARYAEKHGLAILQPIEVQDVVHLMRASQVTPLHSHLIGKVGADGAVASLVLGSANARECALIASKFDPALPVLVVFNVPLNLGQYLQLRSNRISIVPIAGFVDDTEANLPTTVGVFFPAWTQEAHELFGKLDSPVLLQDPPETMTEATAAPIFLLMAEDRWSLSHPLDCHWWSSAPVIDAEPPSEQGVRMFRMLRSSSEQGELGYIGRARFDYELVQYKDAAIEEPKRPASRLLSLACETAIANAYFNGCAFDFMPAAMRRQAGLPALGSLGGVRESLDILLQPVEQAVYKYRKMNDDRLNYQIIQEFAAGFGLAVERNVLQQAVARWQALSAFTGEGLSFKPPARQIASMFYVENCR